jgi:polar amino acid transport system substrate-binding protein
MLKCLILAILIAPSLLLSANPLVIAISDFPPAIDLSDENYGVHGALVLDALRKTKQPFEIKILSWTRIKKMLDTEDICSFGWVKNEERQKRWQYSRPYNADISYLWGRKDNKLKLLSLNDALKYRIGITRGFSYGQQLYE